MASYKCVPLLFNMNRNTVILQGLITSNFILFLGKLGFFFQLLSMRVLNMKVCSGKV